MRRSVRDAIVGFSIIGGMAAFAGTMLWLRGVRLSANAWNISANFENASGLAERSPVTYRGILIGTVGKIDITPQSIKARLEIDNGLIQLPKPVFAKVVTSSLLGGDVQVSLISLGKPLPPKSPLPGSKNCFGSKVLCDGETIEGQSLMSISTLTEQFEEILKKADKEDIVSNLIASTKQFDLTQKHLDELIVQVKEELKKAQPIINNLVLASEHFNNILAALDNPKTLKDLQQTASSTSSLTKKIDALGDDMGKIMNDSELKNALRSVTIGLGELFNELYPRKLGK